MVIIDFSMIFMDVSTAFIDFRYCSLLFIFHGFHIFSLCFHVVHQFTVSMAFINFSLIFYMVLTDLSMVSVENRGNQSK